MGFFQMDGRSGALLSMLLEHQDYVTVAELSRKLGVSRRSVYYDLDKINDWLGGNDLPPIQAERLKGIYIPPSRRHDIAVRLESKETTYSALQIKERTAMIICMLLAQKEPIFIERLSSACGVSRNTIFNDLKGVRERLEGYELCLKFESHVGYTIDGKMIRKRAVFLYYLDRLLPLIRLHTLPDIEALNFYDEQAVDILLGRLKSVEAQLGCAYVEGVLHALSILLYAIIQNPLPMDFEDIDVAEIMASKEFAAVGLYFSELEVKEQVYLAMHFLGSRVQVPTCVAHNHHAFEMAEELVDRFEQITCIQFDRRNQLVEMLANHLNMSIYRYVYGIQIGNPLMEEIRTSYADLFDITSKAVKSLKRQLSMPIPASEIAYITMHFGGFLKQHTHHKLYKILMVCPNGISTASLLKGEVESLHPSVEVVGVTSTDAVSAYERDVDFIISTVDVQSSVPVIRVSPIITEEERIRILSRLTSGMVRYKPQRVTLEKILDIVSPHLGAAALEQVKMELSAVFRPTPVQGEEAHSIRLSDVLFRGRLAVADGCGSWKQAIEMAAKPLIQEGSIEPRYVDAMIRNVETYGPYIVVLPELALGHAQPKDGVHTLGVSFLKLGTPVSFDERPVSMVMILAPVDQQSHLGIMKDIMALFGKAEFLEALAGVTDALALYETFMSHLNAI